jgi:alanine racemase
MKNPSCRPVWAEISLGRLRNNYRWLATEASKSAHLLAVVKANAYGHSLDLCAPAVVEAGAEWLGVTSLEEGQQARALCPTVKILVISGPWRGQAEAFLDAKLTPVAWESYQLEELAQRATALGAPAGSVGVHMELDTGMSRQGVNLQNGLTDLDHALTFFSPGSPLRLEGLMTHFSAPEDLASSETNRQLGLLAGAVERVLAAGLHPEWLHAGSSATLLRGEHLAPLGRLAERLGARLMLRPGLALYGLLPRFSPKELAAPMNLSPARLALRPVLSWKTRVVGLRKIPAGAVAGYNSTFTAQRETTLALLPLGYADGLRRGLSGQFSLLIQGQLAPLAGRVSMDQTLMDVTEIAGIQIGDEVVLIGEQGELALTAYDHADPIGAIPWEIPCGITARVPRIAIP